MSNRIILHSFCWCLVCTLCKGALFPSAGGRLFARELRLSHSYFCSWFSELLGLSFSLTTGIIKYIILNMVSLNANTLPFAWEAGRVGGDIFLMLTVSSGHRLLAPNKAKGNTGLAPCNHSCSWANEIKICPTAIFLGRLGLQASRMDTSVPGQANESEMWRPNSVLFAVVSLPYVMYIWFIHWKIYTD